MLDYCILDLSNNSIHLFF